jgi:hypothetical protein
MRRRKTIPAVRIEDALKTCLPSLQATEREMYPYRLPTAYGTLWISPCDGAIRTRFEEVPPTAPCGTSLNPYSGKWNFECLDDDADVGRAIYWIERIAA